MRFLQLIPGTGNFYCGSCLRDDWLGKALRDAGHEVTVAPLYLPLVLEGEPLQEGVHLGGIRVYLQETWWGRRLPRWLFAFADRPSVLRWAARKGEMTSPKDLGQLTLSMLRGEHGHQRRELDRLATWAATQPPPDALLLSNALLSGVGVRLRRALARPVVCSLQGEAPFLDSLPDPFRESAWRLLAEQATHIDGFVAVSRSYGDVMARRLGIDEKRIHVVHNGIDVSGFPNEPPVATNTPPVLGFFARQCPEKGLHHLVEAFLKLKLEDRVPGLTLRVAGARLRTDGPYVEALARRIQDAGMSHCVEFLSNVDRDEKVAFLRSLSVLSVPATSGESFGLYVLEALAAGVPVVQPHHGAFEEILAATGGGVLVPSDDGEALATALAELLLDATKRRALGDAGMRAVHQRFTAAHMAHAFAEACTMILRSPRAEG